MFKLMTTESFKQKVDIEIPQDMGKTQKASFVVEFKLLSRERIEEVIQQLQTGELTEGELLRDVVVGFDEVQDEDGNPLDYTEANRNRLLNIAYVHTGVMKAYLATFEGRQSRRKN